MRCVTTPDADTAPLVVFDFDHTLYHGDSGSQLYRWLIQRAVWRMALAVLLTPLAGPLLAWLPTRRLGISLFVWAGTVGLRERVAPETLIARFLAANQARLQTRLLPKALEVLRLHCARGDQVVIATGAPPPLARGLLAWAGVQNVPVIGTELGPMWGGLGVVRHCHHAMKMQMLRDAGYTEPVAVAYSDSSADLPLLQAAHQPVVVNPKPARVAWFRRRLPVGTPILDWGCPGRGGATPAV